MLLLFVVSCVFARPTKVRTKPAKLTATLISHLLANLVDGAS
jgi:hypothetical protein